MGAAVWCAIGAWFGALVGIVASRAWAVRRQRYLEQSRDEWRRLAWGSIAVGQVGVAQARARGAAEPGPPDWYR